MNHHHMKYQALFGFLSQSQSLKMLSAANLGGVSGLFYAFCKLLLVKKSSSGFCLKCMGESFQDYS